MRKINTKIALKWVHEQFGMTVHALFYFVHNIMDTYIHDDKKTIFTRWLHASLALFVLCWWHHNLLLIASQCNHLTLQLWWKHMKSDIVICNSLVIDFINGDIHGQLCKNLGSISQFSHISDSMGGTVILQQNFAPAVTAQLPCHMQNFRMISSFGDGCGKKYFELHLKSHHWNGPPGINLCMRPANERWCYIVTWSLIGWAHTQNDLWTPHPHWWLCFESKMSYQHCNKLTWD